MRILCITIIPLVGRVMFTEVFASIYIIHRIDTHTSVNITRPTSGIIVIQIFASVANVIYLLDPEHVIKLLTTPMTPDLDLLFLHRGQLSRPVGFPLAAIAHSARCSVQEQASWAVENRPPGELRHFKPVVAREHSPPPGPHMEGTMKTILKYTFTFTFSHRYK